jgi:hypothetical protein
MLIAIVGSKSIDYVIGSLPEGIELLNQTPSPKLVFLLIYTLLLALSLDLYYLFHIFCLLMHSPKPPGPSWRRRTSLRGHVSMEEYERVPLMDEHDSPTQTRKGVGEPPRKGNNSAMYPFFFCKFPFKNLKLELEALIIVTKNQC